MILKEIIYGYDGIIKGIVQGDSDKEYVVSYDSDTEESICTCPLFVFHRQHVCKHQLFLLDNIDWNMTLKAKRQYKNFLCGCTTIDSLMGDGFPQGSTTAIYGQPGRGKTILSAQLTLACIKNLKQDVIIIETEGNREQDFLELLSRFKDRWELTEDEISEHIHFIPVIEDFQEQTKSMIDLLEMFGYEVDVDSSKKSAKEKKKGDRYTIVFRDCKPKLDEKILKTSGLIIIDSLTKPLKATVGSKTQNLPARADLTARLFAKLVSVATKYELGIIIVHHASVNPTQMYGRDFGRAWGGDEIIFNSKYVLLIMDSDMSARAIYGDTARRIMLKKHPYNANVDKLFPVNLKENYGYTDDK